MSTSPSDQGPVYDAVQVWDAIATIKESIEVYPGTSDDDLLRWLHDYGYTMVEELGRLFGWYDEWYREASEYESEVSYEESIQWVKDRLDLRD